MEQHRYVTIPREALGLASMPLTPKSRDYYTHVLLGNVLGKKKVLDLKQLIVLPLVNVDSSKTASEYTAIASGDYLLVAATHKLYQADAYPAFYIVKKADINRRPSSLADWYLSNLRKDLPTVTGGKVSYINFHRAGINTDASLGCFTAPKKEFDLWRSMYSMGAVCDFKHIYKGVVDIPSILNYLNFEGVVLEPRHGDIK